MLKVVFLLAVYEFFTENQGNFKNFICKVFLCIYMKIIFNY